jgi:hypothetical protein
MWARTQEHTKLFQEGLICQSILDLLPMVQKYLYYYMVTMILSFCSKQKDRVMKLKNRQKDIFKNSGNFPWIVEPEKYLKEILSFMHK